MAKLLINDAIILKPVITKKNKSIPDLDHCRLLN